MAALDTVAAGTVAPGVYRLLDYRPADRLLETVTEWGWVAAHVDARLIQDKRSLIEAFGQALSFPDYAHGQGFGRNWDAFEEMITDLSWLPAPGIVILVDRSFGFARREPQAWHTALSILEGACERWRLAGVPFYVLIRHLGYLDRHLPKLS